MYNQSESKKRNPEHKMESTLRGVDLNLLTVFDTVMQEQNITRAAHHLSMSQPAVSNAVSRLKVMFNDELFLRHGRGIQPTSRARELFNPIRQALQLVRNELPGSDFVPESSERSFKLAICSPCDLRFVPAILSETAKHAPKLKLKLDAEFDLHLAEKLRFQEVDFVIDYIQFVEQGFSSVELFSDELVVVASKSHPRLRNGVSLQALLNEKHAKLSKLNGVRSFSEQAYRDLGCVAAYKGTSLSNLLYVVSQSDLITIAPRWLVENLAERLALQIFECPTENATISGYLSWHESSQKDRGHEWMRDLLTRTCKEARTS